MDNGKVVNLGAERALRENDNAAWSPAECLDNAADEVRSGERLCDRVLILFLDKGPDGLEFTVGWQAANMQSSEMIALMEITKARLITEMGF
jgi:hypothetical protein